MRQKVDWKDLIKRGGDLIVAEQNASYAFLQEKLGISPGIIVKLLNRLQAKGLVRRGKQRRWVVLVNRDGSPKGEAEVPEKRRFRKIRRKPEVNGAFANSAKIEFVQQLAKLAEGEKARILREVANDLVELSKNRKFFEALKD